MTNKYKERLRRNGEEIYFKYFFNDNEKLNIINNKLKNNIEIDENDYDIIFDLPVSYKESVLELISYYPKLLKSKKNITASVVENIYEIYGETISIMKISKSISNVRGKLKRSIDLNSKRYNRKVEIDSEDIILIKTCPILKIPIIYGQPKTSDNSPSIDRIDNNLGYTKDNVQLISLLANRMKSSANEEQLITFSKYIIENYKNS